eukprot:7190593-Pyramimonas_sp.AAC.1
MTSRMGLSKNRRIAALIDNLLQSNRPNVQPEASTTSGNKQTPQQWWHYLTREDWGVLNDKQVDYTAKVARLIERGLSFGLVDPEEQTAKWALACLLYTSPSPRDRSLS